jgi:hypothetical protein
MPAGLLLIGLVCSLAGQPTGQPLDQPAAPQKPSAVWDAPGGPRPREMVGKQNAALLYYKAWDGVDFSLLDQVHRTYRNEPRAVLPPAAATILVDHQKFIAAVLLASETPECDWGVAREEGPNALLPHLAHLRATTRFLGADARRLAATDSVGAAKRLRAIVRISTQMRTDRCLISALVSAAISHHGIAVTRTLMDEGSLTPEGAHIVLAAFRALPEDPFAFRDCMQTERQMGIDWARVHFTGPDAGRQLAQMYLADADTPEIKGRIEAMDEAEMNADLDLMARYYDELEKYWGHPGKEKDIAALEQRLLKGEFGVIARVTAPALSRANQGNFRAIAAVDSVINDLQAYIRDGKAAGSKGE